MANLCFNTIKFSGAENQLNSLQDFFTNMAAKEKMEEAGQLPSFIQMDKGHMFFIDWQDDLLTYETKWSPNIEVTQKIADFFEVDFIHSYNELGNLIYGEFIYRNGKLVDVFLEPKDFDLYEQKEDDEDKWIFEGREYEDNYEILETLLQRKKEKSLVSV